MCHHSSWTFYSAVINLTLCEWARFPKPTTALGLVLQAFWRVPLFTEWIGASSFEVILAWPSRHSTTGTFLWDFGFSMFSFHSAAWKNSETDSAVSFLHVYWHRGGNYNCLLWSTARWLPIANNLQEFFVHAVLSPDSWPRRFFHNFRFWRQNSYFVNLARYFSSPLFSICDNEVLFSSEESPGRTIPIRSWVSQTLVFLICTSFPRFHQMGSASLIIEFRPIPNRIPEYHHFISKNNCQKVRTNLDRIIVSSDPEVVLDHVSDLSGADAIPASSISKNREMSVTLNWARWFSIVHWIDHLHFLDAQHCFQVRTGTSTYLGFESYLPTWKRWWCGEFVKLELRHPKSWLISHVILWIWFCWAENSWLMVSLQISALD